MTTATNITCQELKSKIEQESLVLIDVRDAGAYDDGHLEGAKNLSQEQLFEFIEQADKDAATVVYCYHGNSSKMAAAMLIHHGFTDVYSLEGGYTAWSEL